MSRWAAVLLPLHLLLLSLLSLWAWFAFLAVMKATSCRVHSAWSVWIQANGALILQPAQVPNTTSLKYTMQLKAVVPHKNQIICDNNVTSPPAALKCLMLEAPENGQINCSSSEPAYNSECFFSCDKDYELHGHELLTCDRHGNWTEEKPTCQGIISNNESESSVIFHFFKKHL